MKYLIIAVLFLTACDCDRQKYEYSIKVNYEDGLVDTIYHVGGSTASFRVGNRGVLRKGENGIARNVQSFSIIKRTEIK